MPDVTIQLRKDGPYRVEGEVILLDHDGTPIPLPGPKFSLCRCGASSKKPFCDGTHSKIGFKGAEEARQEFDAGQS
ncbi:MAG: CDGSH iron-sulfur domain-containing protein [Gemmatimonadota bacterium]|nr:CDGSH iron-sulfur domain-containing protein [Gemmatimonadota bacterium]